jgi:hypothetical protein
MEKARWPGAPPGYRFAPKPRELILCYLNPWVAGQPPFGEAEGVMCAADVYSADPGTLTSRLRRFGHDDGNWYFLCVARWKDGNAGTRMSRAVRGGGTWHGSGKRMPVGRHGYRQTFEYRLPGGGGKSAWLMEEIGSSLPEATGAEGVKVLCRVHRTPRAATAAGGDAGEEQRREADEVVRPPKKQRCEVRQEHDDDDEFAVARYCWAPPPPPTTTDVGCSYASTSRTALVNAAAPTTAWQQQKQQPMTMEHYCAADVNGGGVLVKKDEEQPLEVLLPDEGWELFGEMNYGFGYAAEDAQMNNELMRNIFSCPTPKPSDDAALQESDDPKGETTASTAVEFL